MHLRYYLALAVTIVPVLTWLFFQIAVVMRGPVNGCPRCFGRRTRPSFPRVLDRFLPAFIAARRCECCGTRFYALTSVNYVHRSPARPAGPQLGRLSPNSD